MFKNTSSCGLCARHLRLRALTLPNRLYVCNGPSTNFLDIYDLYFFTT